MKNIKKKIIITIVSFCIVISGTYVSLKKVTLTEKELIQIIKLQLSKGSDFDGGGPFDIIFLGPYTMEIADFGLVYYVRHLGAIPISYRESISLINQIHLQKIEERRKIEQANEDQLLNRLKDKNYKVE